MKETVVLFLFSLSLSLFALASAHSYCEVDGICHGLSLGYASTETAEGCHEFCSNVTDCEWYTYEPATDFCVALADCAEIDRNCTTCISGRADCNCFVSGECHGTLINIMTANSQETCLYECQQVPECTWFTYMPSEQACVLLQDCDLDENSVDFVSGERTCKLSFDNSKLFYHRGKSSAWSHMPNAANSTSSCIQPPACPIDLEGSVGAVVNGQITICGGAYTADCFSLNQNFNVWLEFPGLSATRGYSDSIMTEQGWWITGGYTESSYLSSTVLFNESSHSWVAGPSLPTGRNHHCIATINAGFSFLAGGENGANLDDAWIYSWAEDRWMQMPDMPVANNAMACTWFADEQDEKRIIVAGGHATPIDTRVFSFEIASMSWTQLPNLPSSAHGATLIQDLGDLFLINPTSDNIMQYDESTSTFAVIPGLLPGVSDSFTTVVPVSDFNLNGC